MIAAKRPVLNLGVDVLEPRIAPTVNDFLKINGIDGKSADSKHKNEIDIQS